MLICVAILLWISVTFFVVVNTLFGLFLLLVGLGSDRFSPQEDFLFLFPMIFELKPLKFVGEETFHYLKNRSWGILIFLTFFAF